MRKSERQIKKSSFPVLSYKHLPSKFESSSLNISLNRQSWLIKEIWKPKYESDRLQKLIKLAWLTSFEFL